MRRGQFVNFPDCFYRLLSGKRLAKPQTLKSISVSSLLECQDACIREATFQCRSVSYRYMPSGYSYSVREEKASIWTILTSNFQVSNCELSPYYIMTSSSVPTHHDFVDDFDYDFFQREPYCKTSGGGAASAYGGTSTFLSISKEKFPSF